MRVWCAWLVVLAWLVPATAKPTLIKAADWSAYKALFLDPSGRIVDNANGGISHSEGQGYGMLLATMAGDRAGFDLIWAFTRGELLLRDDGLAAWKWDPAASPHVVDVNNATDGDMLIAYALARAGASWKRPDLVAEATAMVKALGKLGVIRHGGRMLVAPGATGFGAGDRSDGPVVNLSYWIFETFPVFAELDESVDWNRVGADGLQLLASTALGPADLPPDWLSLASRPRAAKGFPPEFGYNALRIPLYLMRAGLATPALLAPYAEPARFAITDLPAGTIKDSLDDRGYRIIPALAACVANGTPVPEPLLVFEPKLYYPATLHLLALAHLAANNGDCR